MIPDSFHSVVCAAYVVVAEAHDVVAVFELAQSNELADKSFADEQAASLPFDLAAVSHATHLMIGVIPGIVETLGHRTGLAGSIEIGRWSLPQCFMRALLIIVPAKGIETGLLLAGIVGRRLGCLGLESAMHAFVSAVVASGARGARRLFCAYILAAHRHAGGSLTRAAFLSARNDAAANIAIIAAGLVTAYLWHSIWPDLIVGLAIAVMNLDAAKEVWQAAREEHAAVP